MMKSQLNLAAVAHLVVVAMLLQLAELLLAVAHLVVLQAVHPAVHLVEPLVPVLVRVHLAHLEPRQLLLLAHPQHLVPLLLLQLQAHPLHQALNPKHQAHLALLEPLAYKGQKA